MNPYKRTDWSDEKDRIFSGIVSWWIHMAKNHVIKQNSLYHYIDMNANDGSHSPSIFIKKADDINIPYYACMIELDKQAFGILKTRFMGNTNVNCRNGDHSVEAPRFIRLLSGRYYGMIYHDPCEEPSFATLSECSKLYQCSMIDIVLMCSATTIKRCRSIQGHQRLADGIRSVNKKYKFIRVPERDITGVRKHQWTFSIMSNYSPSNDWHTKGIYDINSTEGRDILTWLDRTRDELIEMGEYDRLNNRMDDLVSRMTSAKPVQLQLL